MKKIVTILVTFLFFVHTHAQRQDTVPDMTRDGATLNEVVIMGNNSRKDMLMKSSQSLVRIDKSEIVSSLSGSLMQSLSSIPGVKAINIGSSQSKPAIRGLGFNRMAVTENGIKHEGQQWGEEHGLEIDQFAVDCVEIIKGPAALLYGSDAIGGVINLYSDIPPAKPFEGKTELFMRSVNESLGLSVRVAGKNNWFYYKANLTLVDYADYKVPTDSIQYYSYYIRLKEQRLRNTAGKERDGSLLCGYAGERFSTSFRISDTYVRSGFFANAHGLEVRLSDIDYDRSRCDIDLPRHDVNHLKVTNHSAWRTGAVRWESNLSYQNNLRREHSEPVSHGYMPMPPGTLERKYIKNTYTASLGMKALIAERHSLNAGLNVEHQHNRRSGWGFIIPDFETTSWGGYAFDRYFLSDDLILNAGIRINRVVTRIHSYHDWYKTPVAGSDSVYRERSERLRRSFNSFTWSLGVNYSAGAWIWKANIGKSFRVPIPKELGADGVNYHIFRYEKGEAGLSPEESYQFDAGIYWHNEALDIRLDSYVNYFPNYIYLNPTSAYTEGLQTYYYTQSRVIRYGVEADIRYRFLRRLEAVVKGEYLYAEQLSGNKKGYTLPFSPPWSADVELKYTFGSGEDGETGFISAAYRTVGNQHEIVPPEKSTAGYSILNLSAGKVFAWKECRLRLNLQALNLLGKKYYDHTSYYRQIDVPEPGRNFSLLIGFDF